MFAVVIEGSDKPGFKIEAENFRIVALQGEEVVVFLFFLLGDVAQQDKGVPLVAGDRLRRGRDPAVRAVFRRTLAVFTFRAAAAFQFPEKAALVEIEHAFEGFWGHAVDGAPLDERGKIGFLLDDGHLLAVVEQRRDRAAPDVEGEDLGIIVLQGEEVVVFLFLLLGDVAHEEDGLSPVAGRQGHDERQHPVIGPVKAELAVFDGKLFPGVEFPEDGFGGEEIPEDHPIPRMDAGFHDRDDVLVEFAADIDGREQLGVAEQAGQLVGGEVHPVDLGVAVLKGYLKVFFVPPVGEFRAFLLVDIPDALEDVARAVVLRIGEGDAGTPAGPGLLGKLVFEMDIPVVYACREGCPQPFEGEVFAEGVTVLWEDMAEEQLEMGGVIARSVGGEVIAVGQKLKMAGAEIHVHDIMIALAEGAGEGIALGLGLALLGRQKAL